MKWILIVTSVLFVAGCGTDNGDVSTLEDSVVEHTGNVPLDTAVVDHSPEATIDSTIHVAAGDDFSITVEANPTTGYQWKCDGIEQETIIVEQAGEPVYLQDENPEGMMGVGGTETWNFKVVLSGEAVIQLGYYPPGSGNEGNPAQTELYYIYVE
ncbi:MAG: protease inhibitor I42 family protein [Candidatus Aegiribacteria sp.]|nr:protease inhibitor I42 family protein [Candidatus Aegiribacteria sp.]